MSGRIFFGVILIILGTVFLLDQMQIIEFGELVGVYWPIILIAIGLYHILKKNISPISGIILILIGAFFQLRELDMLPTDIWKYFWPVLLILIGLNIIFSRGSKPRIPVYSGDKIDHFVMLSGFTTRNNSHQFKGGSVVALFGGAEIDLSDAEIGENEACLDLTAVFGGIDIRVPEHWKVIANGLPLFGGWENKTKLKYMNDGEHAPVLRVRCVALFGGVEIKN
jgi:Predicted membrane protein (DUF2154).